MSAHDILWLGGVILISAIGALGVVLITWIAVQEVRRLRREQRELDRWYRERGE